MKNQPSLNARHGRGFTLIELLVVIAIIAILAAILFPVFARARENARRASCMSNLKEIGLSILQYTQDYDERYPQLYNYSQGSTTSWVYNIQPYIKSSQIFNCPSYSGAQYTGTPTLDALGYGMSVLFEPGYYDGGHGFSLAAIDQPSQTINVIDCHSMRAVPNGYNRVAAYNISYRWPDYRHLETTNVLFCDGHVKSLREGAVDQRDTTQTADKQFVLWGFSS